MNHGRDVEKIARELWAECSNETDLKTILDYFAQVRAPLVEALKIYARRYGADGKCWNWINRVCDSYSGECAHFDWQGDEQDEAWEIAERALTGAGETK